MYPLSHVYVAFPWKSTYCAERYAPDTSEVALRNFVANTLGETPQEQYLRPRRTLHHLTM